MKRAICILVAVLGLVCVAQAGDVDGHWEHRSLGADQDGTDVWLWSDFGSIDVEANGTYAGSGSSQPDGETWTESGTVTDMGDGLVQIQGADDDGSWTVDKSINVAFDFVYSVEVDGDLDEVMASALIKSPASSAVADLQGNWRYYSLWVGDGWAGWEKSSTFIIIDSDGDFSASFVDSDEETNEENATIISTGIGRYEVDGESGVDLAMNASKDILVKGEYFPSDDEFAFEILLKQGSNYQPSDLIGKWRISSLMYDPGAGRPLEGDSAVITVATNGAFTGTWTDWDGSESPMGGTMTVNSAGEVSVAVTDGPTLSLFLNAGKNTAAGCYTDDNDLILDIVLKVQSDNFAPVSLANKITTIDEGDELEISSFRPDGRYAIMDGDDHYEVDRIGTWSYERVDGVTGVVTMQVEAVEGADYQEEGVFIYDLQFASTTNGTVIRTQVGGFQETNEFVLSEAGAWIPDSLGGKLYTEFDDGEAGYRASFRLDGTLIVNDSEGDEDKLGVNYGVVTQFFGFSETLDLTMFSATSGVVQISDDSEISATIFTFEDGALYWLSVTNGTGDGAFEGGESAQISADLPMVGTQFDRWTGSGVASPDSMTTSVTMPAADHAVAAMYKPREYNFTVTSAHGSPIVPTNGIQSHGSVVNCSVASPDGDSETRYICTGWIMTGNEPSSGTASSFSMTITNNASLTWRWSTNYYLTVVAPTNGTLDVSNGWKTEGLKIILTANPDPGYKVKHWLVNGEITAEGGESYTVPEITSATTVEVVFEKNAAMPWLNLLLE